MHLHPRRGRAAGTRLALVLSAALAVGACTGGGGEPSPSPSPSTPATYSVLPVIVSSELVVGTDRMLFSFLDETGNRPVASPDRTASVRLYPEAKGPTAAVEADGTFMWAIEDVSGVYRATVDLAEPGAWIAEFTTEAPGAPLETIPFTFDVQADGSALRVGEAAASVDTPTLADVDGDPKRISTDIVPEPSFYEVSVADALADGRPFLLIFATPAFCRSASCGPMLEQVKAISAERPELLVINVEPYELTWDGARLQPVVDESGQFAPVPAVDAYGILSEPWIYTIDGSGTIAGSFEGVVDDAELDAAVDAILE
jgi:hypothetical protein